VPIGHGNSFFWSWKRRGKSLLKKSGHPAYRSAMVDFIFRSELSFELVSVPQLGLRRN